MYIRCSCYMFRPYVGHHQATLIVWGNHCTVHFVLSTLRHIIVVVIVVNFLGRIFSRNSRIFKEKSSTKTHN
jgi:hypothetical protein